MPTNLKKKHDFSLQIFQPIALGGRFVKGIQQNTDRYRQRKRLQGGFWSATWDSINLSPAQTKVFFMNRLGFHVQQKSGGQRTWEGYIHEMDLYQNGITRRMSLENVRNSVKCIYTDVDDEQRKDTGWYKDDTSISRYGEIQEILFLDKTTTAAAEAYAQTILAEQSQPWPEVISVKEPQEEDETDLSITAVGYIYTLNFQYLSISSAKGTISDKISAVLSTNCPFLVEGSIASNTIQVAPPDNETKAWDWLNEIAEIGDGTQPYVLQVDLDRRISYKALNPKPTLKWNGRNLKTTLGTYPTAGKWALWPGVLRDYSWHSQSLPSAMFLEDARDTIVTEIEASVDYDIPLLKTEHYDESEFMSALARNLKG